MTERQRKIEQASHELVERIAGQSRCLLGQDDVVLPGGILEVAAELKRALSAEEQPLQSLFRCEVRTGLTWGSVRLLLGGQQIAGGLPVRQAHQICQAINELLPRIVVAMCNSVEKERGT